MSTTNFDQEFTSQQIENFFLDSVGNLDGPVLSVKQNCVTVGPYKIVTSGENFQVQRSKKVVADFSRRSWAVAFALRLYNGDQRNAEYLISAENRYKKITEDCYVYRKHLKRAQRRAEEIKIFLYEARLSRAESELEALLQDIEPVLKNSHR